MIKSTEEQWPGEWRKHISKDMEKTLIEWKYFDMKSNSTHIITQTGLGELRDLEQINIKDKTFWTAILALAISIISFSKSIGWF